MLLENIYPSEMKAKFTLKPVHKYSQPLCFWLPQTGNNPDIFLTGEWLDVGHAYHAMLLNKK